MGNLRKITEAGLLEAREALAGGETWKSVTQRFGISEMALRSAWQRRDIPYPRKHRISPPIDLSEATPGELGYLAGIVDGEGSIDVPRHRVVVYGTDKALIDWMLGWGGLSYTREPTGLGSNSRLVQYGWYIGSKTAVRDFLTPVAPFMIVKREKALQALDLIRS